MWTKWYRRLPGLNSISDFKWLSQASQSGKMKNMETRKWFSFPEAIFVWLQSIQTVVNWSPGSTRRWFGSDCLATRSSLTTPGTVACQNQHQLARLAEPQVAVQAIHWRHLGPAATCPDASARCHYRPLRTRAS